MDWALCACVLGTHRFQCSYTAGALVQARPRKCYVSMACCNGGQHRHVARAVRHCDNEFASRLSAVVLEHVLPHRLGLGDVRRHDWTLPGIAVSVPAISTDDLDFRNANTGAEIGGRMSTEAPIYGLLAEF